MIKFIKNLKTNTVILIFVTLICILGLQLVNNLLKTRIENSANNYLKQTIHGLGNYFPPSLYNNNLNQSCYIPINNAFGNDPVVEKVFVPKYNGKIVGFIIVGSTYHGYSGRIQDLLVTDRQGTIKALRILQQLETPGLGTKIVTTDWVHEFDNWTLARARLPYLAVKKDGGEIDQFTGATITPRAVTNQVRGNMQGVVAKLVANPQQVLANDFRACDATAAQPKDLVSALAKQNEQSSSSPSDSPQQSPQTGQGGK